MTTQYVDPYSATGYTRWADGFSPPWGSYGGGRGVSYGGSPAGQSNWRFRSFRRSPSLPQRFQPAQSYFDFEGDSYSAPGAAPPPSGVVGRSPERFIPQIPGRADFNYGRNPFDPHAGGDTSPLVQRTLPPLSLIHISEPTRPY